jgi:hypothetical protein
MMKGTRKPGKGESPADLRRSIITAWTRMGGGPVGRKELAGIQATLGTQTSLPSPAAIARVLADHGADLKHPEVIDCDAEWRTGYLADLARREEQSGEGDLVKTLRLQDAESMIKEWEKQRLGFERSGDTPAAREVQTLAIEMRKTAQLRAKDRSLPQAVRREQAEISEWLLVWLQTPGLFEQWLELRKTSPGYRKFLV